MGPALLEGIVVGGRPHEADPVVDRPRPQVGREERLRLGHHRVVDRHDADGSCTSPPEGPLGPRGWRENTFSFRLTACLRPPTPTATRSSRPTATPAAATRLPRVPRPGVPRRLRRVARQVQEPVQGPAATTGACATGTTRCATASRRPTASSARSSSRTPCRRSSRASCCSPSRRPPTSTSTASPASTPTTAGWSTGATSSRSGAPASARSSSTTSTTPSTTCTWIKEHGLRGGVLLPNIPPDVKWVKPLYDPVLRPAVGGVPGPRDPGQRARRHRQPRLRQVPGVDAPLHQRGALLLAAPVRAADAVGRVRALPAPQVRDDRDGLRVGAAAARRSSTSMLEQHPRHRAPPARSATATSTSCRGRPPSTSTRTAGWA